MSASEPVISDYRNHRSTTMETSTSTSNQRTKPNTSYSTVLSQQQPMKFPDQKQAIIFSTIEGIKIHEYLLALGTLINPRQILFASRISNNRICIYLASPDLVNTFMNEHGAITINDETIRARRLISPSERLILSNVCPIIPHAHLEQSLQQIGLKLLSPTTFLRVNIANPDYAHIMSFRRQVFIAPLENTTIPDSILINYENTPYRIFLSLDNLTCFKCKKPGHISSQCTNEIPQQLSEPPIISPPENESRIAPASENVRAHPTDTSSSVSQNPTNLSEPANSSCSSTKRTITETLTPTEETSADMFRKPVSIEKRANVPKINGDEEEHDNISSTILNGTSVIDDKKSTTRFSIAVSEKKCSQGGSNGQKKSMKSKRSNRSANRQEELKLQTEIMKKELEQELMKKQQEILDLQLAVKLSQLECGSTDSEGNESRSQGSRSLVSEGPDVQHWGNEQTIWNESKDTKLKPCCSKFDADFRSALSVNKPQPRTEKAKQMDAPATYPFAFTYNGSLPGSCDGRRGHSWMNTGDRSKARFLAKYPSNIIYLSNFSCCIIDFLSRTARDTR
ncbi:unnamed protein product [Phaedon cochleariae]|uniref:CCHC-type domain-containing protein n=1 Tax=Phaedon cochleariae TaxID=80249 RepID=A0A9N9X5D4_PHACE|nr:unnamed protein product [Phaedon cochleariae]